MGPLHVAAGRTIPIKALLAYGADINAPSYNGATVHTEAAPAVARREAARAGQLLSRPKER